MFFQGDIPYLALDSMLSHPNTSLVSAEGCIYRINSFVLAAACRKFRPVLAEIDHLDEMAIFTGIPDRHLLLFCQFICTGVVAVESEESEALLASFADFQLDPAEIIKEHRDLTTCSKVLIQQSLIATLSALNANKKDLAKEESTAMEDQDKSLELCENHEVSGDNGNVLEMPLQNDDSETDIQQNEGIKIEIEYAAEFDEGDRQEALIPKTFVDKKAQELKNSDERGMKSGMAGRLCPRKKKIGHHTWQDEYGKTCEGPATYFHFPQDEERSSRPFQCTRCTRGFAVERHFFQHIKRHDAKGYEEAWTCDDCDDRFHSPQALMRHKTIQHHDKYEECTRCKGMISLENKSSIKTHKGVSSKRAKTCRDARLQCVFCGSREEAKCRIERHLRQTNHDRKCALCPAEFETFAEHKYHIATKHEGKLMVRCFTCLEYFEDEAQRNCHIREVHGRKGEIAETRKQIEKENVSKRPTSIRKEMPDPNVLEDEDCSLVCSICNKRMRNENLLAAHIRNHNRSSVELVDEEQEIVEHGLGPWWTWTTQELGEDELYEPDEEELEVNVAKRSKKESKERKATFWNHNITNPILQSFESLNPHKMFECEKCPETFRTVRDMRQHLFRHETSFNPAKAWSCFFCPETFAVRDKLTEHEDLEHFKATADTITCPICKKLQACQKRGRNAAKTLVWAHLNATHKDRLPQNKSTLKQRIYHCICCGEKFELAKSYKVHLQNSGPYHDDKCPLCPGVVFKSWSEHKSHVLDAHGGKFVIRCKFCPKVFESELLLRHHQEDLHKVVREKTICTICGKSVVDIKFHMKYAHENIGQFSCEKCGAVLSTELKLMSHLSAHEPLPICDICGKTVKSRKMVTHKLVYHTALEDMPFKCTICKPTKGFALKKWHEEHMNIHTGEKPFKCKLCEGVAYASQANLFAHIRSFHKGIKRKLKH